MSQLKIRTTIALSKFYGLFLMNLFKNKFETYDLILGIIENSVNNGFHVTFRPIFSRES